MPKETIKQCCSCEQEFYKPIDNSCPYCMSGNWVNGHIDDPEPENAK